MIRRRIIMLGLVLGLAVNQVMLYQSRAISADSYVVPQLLLDDMQKNMGVNNRAINNYQSQNTQSNQQVINVDKSVYQQPMQTQNNNYYRYEQVNSYDPNRPEWSEFCPYGLENITTKDDTFHMWGTNSRYSADFRNYWVDRKKDFDNHLVQCDSVQDTNARYGCYAKLRQRQQRITENYIDPWQKAAVRDQKLQNALQNWNNSIQNQQYIDAIKNQNVNVNYSGTMNHNINYRGW